MEYKNFLGIGGKQGGTNDASVAYHNALAKYPRPMDCVTAQTYLKNIQADIDAQLRMNTAGGSGAGGSTPAIAGMTQRQAELQAFYNNLQCDTYFSQQQSTDFLNTQLSALQASGQLTGTATSDKTTTYVIIGIIVLALGISSYLIFHKKE